MLDRGAAVRIEEGYTIPWTCPCCKKCWLNAKILAERGIRRCLYGGPFKGYRPMPDYKEGWDG